MNVISTVKNINRRTLTNNTQKVAHVLLSANGEWVAGKQLGSRVKSATTRIRDLRKAQFGQFKVECASAQTLKKRGSTNDFYYRINPKRVTNKQVKTVFKI